MATAPALRPARPIDLRAAGRTGLIIGIAVAFIGSIGMLVSLQDIEIIEPLAFGRFVAIALLVLAGTRAATAPPALEGYAAPIAGSRNLLAGAVAGVAAAGVLAAFAAFIAAVDVRDIFLNMSPELVSFLLFGRETATGLALLAGMAILLGVVGGATHLLPGRSWKLIRVALLSVVGFGVMEPIVAQVLRQVGAGGLVSVLYRVNGLSPVGAVVAAALGVSTQFGPLAHRAQYGAKVREVLRGERRQQALMAIAAVVLLALGLLPQIAGQYLTSVANIAGVFLLMALGLNIVVGFAGLLDLGYVAFFAVGAYVTAVLTSPSSPGFSPELPFLLIVPLVLIGGAIAGLVVGTPVIRMRGDYLAIVTLGFGEIARLLAVSDWLKPVLGGAQGIIRIPNIQIGPLTVESPATYFAAIYGLAAFGAYISFALQNSRIGRAWIAMREDESVAEAMGVNIVSAKLWAFVLGASFASLGGALYATNIHSIFPPSFGVEQSILILIVVIVGGIGSVPGVALGAVVLIGLPELLRQFAEYRYMVYGALLIYMMLRRPGGLIPSRRRARELGEEDRSQDAWFRAQAEDPSTPEAYSQPREV